MAAEGQSLSGTVRARRTVSRAIAFCRRQPQKPRFRLMRCRLQPSERAWFWTAVYVCDDRGAVSAQILSRAQHGRQEGNRKGREVDRFPRHEGDVGGSVGGNGHISDSHMVHECRGANATLLGGAATAGDDCYFVLSFIGSVWDLSGPTREVHRWASSTEHARSWWLVEKGRTFGAPFT